MDSTTGSPRSRTHLSRRQALAALGVSAPAAVLAARPLAAFAQASGTPAAGGGDPKMGDAVPYFNVEGLEIGTLAVKSLTDPFQGYRQTSPPPRGSRFALISVEVTNTSANPWGFDPGRIFLQDDQGFVIYPAFVDLGDAPAEPAIPGGDVAPGTPAAGVIGYVIVKGVTPIRAFFAPAGDRLILLADLRSA